MWSEMAVRHREEVEIHYVHVRRVAGLTQLQLLELLIKRCQDYEYVSETCKLSWGPSSFPQVEVEGS